MPLFQDRQGGAAAGGPAATPEPMCTIYEVVYPDERRRASGEPADEAVSRAFFESPGAASSFVAQNGGTCSPKVVPVSERRRMQRLRLIPHSQPRQWKVKKR